MQQDCSLGVGEEAEWMRIGDGTARLRTAHRLVLLHCWLRLLLLAHVHSLQLPSSYSLPPALHYSAQ